MNHFDTPAIRVLGTSGAWLNDTDPCSSYLVHDADTQILLDCGTGAAAALNRFSQQDRGLDAIIISHAHPDHCFDLVPLLYDHVFGLRQGQRPRLCASAETMQRLNQLATAFSDKQDFWGQAYDVEIFDEADIVRVGRFTCSMRAMPHAITSWSSRIEHESGRTFVYSADVGQAGMDALAHHAENANVLICEAGIPAVLDLEHEARDSHLDPYQAGQVAHEAGVEQLHLVHVPTNYNHPLAKSQAAQNFAHGPVCLPSSGHIIH